MGKTKAGKNKFSKGKSKKDTWKKLQHPDLDDFLQDQREDERLGLAEKANDDLFIIDQQGSDTFHRAAKDEPRRSTRQGGRSVSQAKKKPFVRNKEGPLVDLDSLRCFQNLKPDSAVKDPVVKRNRKRLPGENKSVDMKLKDEVRLYRQRQVKVQEADSTTAEDINDPWSAPDSKSVSSVLTNEWLTDETKRNIVRNRSVHKVKKPTTELRAIEAPHPGLSINPSFIDHQAVIKEVVDLTKAEIQKEQKLIRATAIPKDAKFEDDEEEEIKEETEIKSEPDSDDDDKDGIKRPKAKTRQQKRKARELNEQQRSTQDNKIRLKREAEVFRIKSIRKDILKKEKETKEKLDRKVEKKIRHEKYGQLDLNRYKFEALKPDPLLSDEMGGTFLADAQNSIAGLTLDRFKSLQKRNLIEPTVKQRMVRKYKLKKYQRPSEKMEWEKTGMWNGEKLLNPGDRRRGPPRKRN